MNIIKKYIAHLKDNPEGYWFKRKLFGWGWTPATWQGWLTVAVFIAAILFNFHRIDVVSHSASDTLRPFFIQTAVLLFLFLGVCYLKGEPPQWQWGIPKKDNK